MSTELVSLEDGVFRDSRVWIHAFSYAERLIYSFMRKVYGMEWRIELKHRYLPDNVEIVGIGNVHKPSEVITNAKGEEGSKVLERIKQRVAEGVPIALTWLIESDTDMYLWESMADSIVDEDPNWGITSNLPDVDPPEQGFEDGVTVIY